MTAPPSVSVDGSLDAFVERVAKHARASLHAGSRVGRYIVERPVGAGAMGIVYASHDPELDRKIALKVLRPEVVGTRDALQARVQQEARAMARLSHPNVVAVHDVGTSDGQIFVAMELVVGETLAEWLRRGPPDWQAVVALFSAIARGLAAAHAVGIVHRDLKPQNILVGSDGRPKITDFGLARLSASSEPSTAEPRTREPALKSKVSGLAGTPAYMAPEQRRGEAADPRSDQYAFCVCLHEALYGTRFRAPFDEEHSLKDAEHARSSSELPKALRDVLTRGLSEDPHARFATMDALLDAMGAAVATDRAAGKHSRGRLRPAYLMAAALLVVALSATFSLRSRPDAAAATVSAKGELPVSVTKPEAVPALATAPPPSATSTAPPAAFASAAPRVKAPRAAVSGSGSGVPTSRSAHAATAAAPPADRGAVTAPSSSAPADLLGRRY